jgi:hypothetical protein
MCVYQIIFSPLPPKIKLMISIKFLPFVLLLCLISCKSAPNVKASAENESSDLANNAAKSGEDFNYDLFNYDTLKGIYYGEFSGSPISVVLNYVNQNHAVGYNIHKGLKRNISGTHTKMDGKIIFTLNEPGDNKYDGVFTLQINPSTFEVLGDWLPNSKDLKPKKFTLKKRILHDRDTIIGENNFTNFLSDVSDSLGNISFDQDGSCNYTFISILDTVERKEQEFKIKGNWKFWNKTVEISWEANKVFPSRKSTFFINELEYGLSLVGEKRELYPTYF